MPEPQQQQLTAAEASEILTTYVRRNLGAAAAVGMPSYREDYQVWETWVSGVEGYVKAYIVRLGASHGEWVCRHITVMDSAPGPRRGEG
ncbi:MAG: hypothetical protein JWM80_6408 [Cyanobacteria bacterium RYN_339]|nr:hypothetical protein [Cyanobacteria bacterium RYN_339]